jgi:hypothetical protein
MDKTEETKIEDWNVGTSGACSHIYINGKEADAEMVRDLIDQARREEHKKTEFLKDVTRTMLLNLVARNLLSVDIAAELTKELDRYVKLPTP